MHFVKLGAAKVVGIDISEKMLKVAKTENNAPNIVYLHMAMEHISELDEYFDIVVSSLAFHYVEDFDRLIRECYDLLKPGGKLIFSQEHPLASCYGAISFAAGQSGDAEQKFNPANRWTKDENGKKLYVNLANYAVEGERESTWFVDGVKKYHRTFSTIVNSLAGVGFVLEQMIEPTPTEEILEKHPEQSDLFHKPDFLIVKAGKRRV
jgi:SAM-dependent methyltransferase